MNRDIGVLLTKNVEHLTKLHAEVWPALVAEDEISDEALYLVRQVVSDAQSALDMVATAIDRQYGKNSDRSPYYPLMPSVEKFEEQFAKHFNGVRDKSPGVYHAMALHQPYTRLKEDLALVHDLSRVNKHQNFTRQTRQQGRHIGLNVGGMSLLQINEGGGLQIGGAPPYGHFLDGGVTASEEHGVSAANGTLVTWKFHEPDRPVQPTLESIHNLVAHACVQICEVGDL